TLKNEPENATALNAGTEALEKASYDIASIIYKQQTGEAAGGAAQTAASSDARVEVPGEDDVVEAEFKDE
ncbi:MAG: hypothetical protein ILO36_01425, partial [Abditibacteriota bacterium]|nr:hypothetical protein [Abditibacteriota bacterium]